MKLNKLPKLKIGKINFGLILTLVFILLLCLEGYLLYSELYLKLSADPIITEQTNIVRVNLQAYQKTIQAIQDLEGYQATSLFLNRFNPFN